MKRTDDVAAEVLNWKRPFYYRLKGLEGLELSDAGMKDALTARDLFDQSGVPSRWSPVPDPSPHAKPFSNMADEPDECPKKLLSQRIEKANELLKRCDILEKTIEGLQKLRRKIAAELKFLTSVSFKLCFKSAFVCIISLNISSTLVDKQ